MSFLVGFGFGSRVEAGGKDAKLEAEAALPQEAKERS